MGFWQDVLFALRINTATPGSGTGDTAYVGGNKINQSFEAVGDKIDELEIAANALNADTYRNVFLNPATDELLPDWAEALSAINYSIGQFYGGTVTATVGQKIVFVLNIQTPDPSGSPVPLLTRKYYALRSGALSVTGLDSIEDITPYGRFGDENLTADDLDDLGIFIDLGDIGSDTIVDGFNENDNEPFDVQPGMFLLAVIDGVANYYYWVGPAGNFGDNGTDGPALESYFYQVPQTTPVIIENQYADIAEMLADQGNQTFNALQYVTDASADPDIEAGDAYYRKLESSTATLATDYNRLTAAQQALIQNDFALLGPIKVAATTLELAVLHLNRFVQMTGNTVALTINDDIVELAAETNIYSIKTELKFYGTGPHTITTPDATVYTFNQDDVVVLLRGVDASDGWTVYKDNDHNPVTIKTPRGGLSIDENQQLSLDLNNTGDGATDWQSLEVDNDTTWEDLIYADGKFVGVGSSGTNRVIVSTDGLTWETRALGHTYALRSIAYGNGVWVALRPIASTSSILTSTDLVTWTPRTGATSSIYYHLIFDGTQFIAFGGGNVMTSPDGETWTAAASSGSGSATLKASVYANGLYVVLRGSGTNRISTSPDLVTWSQINVGTDVSWAGLAYGNGVYVGVGTQQSAPYHNRVIYSHNGVDWTIIEFDVATNLRTVIFANGMFVATSLSGSNKVMTSVDGINWTLQDVSLTGGWQALAYGNGIFASLSLTGTEDKVMISEAMLLDHNNLKNKGKYTHEEIDEFIDNLPIPTLQEVYDESEPLDEIVPTHLFGRNAGATGEVEMSTFDFAAELETETDF